MAIETTANNKLLKTGSGRVFPGIWDLTKNTHTHLGFGYPGSGIRQNLARDGELGKRPIFGIAVAEDWDVGVS